MEIRHYQPSDLKKLLPLYVDLGYPTDKRSLEKRLSHLLKQPNYQLKIALLDDQVVGFIGFSKMYFFERDGFYYRILALVVGKSYRHQGVATSLINHVKEVAYLEGACALALNSGIRDERNEAHQFYQNYGFKQASYGFALELS
ncbi:GNAT family N-acetyltransferase [Streptococcus ferus]|uniref:GNAT family N-acetyltransferase n=1 Tax=Streptococcus ferus TaxID=1345 RepID=UPI0035112D31